MLTTPTSGWDEDTAMLSRWGLKPMNSFESPTVVAKERKDLLEATEARRAAAAAAAAPSAGTVVTGEAPTSQVAATA